MTIDGKKLVMFLSTFSYLCGCIVDINIDESAEFANRAHIIACALGIGGALVFIVAFGAWYAMRADYE